VAVALLTAACGSSTISGSQVKSASNSGNVSVGAGANAGIDLTAGTEDAPPNPTARKNPQPGPGQQPPPPTTNGTQPSTAGQDPCSATGANPAVGSRVVGPGAHQPLPQCAVP
jgi:hypothetical protein